MTNLIGNAVKYGGGKPVWVEANDIGDDVEIAVANEGVALSDHEKDVIFEPFRRGSNVAGADGVGLGLYIVKRFAEASGGSVRVDSAEGRVTFRVRLPQDEAAEAP